MSDALILVTSSAALAGYWCESFELSSAAFPDAHALLAAVDGGGIVLLDLAGMVDDPTTAVALCRRYRVVALSSNPSDDEGMIWLQRGAVGYAHAMSTRDVLQQVLETIRLGGTWVGRSIMQRLCENFGRKLTPAQQDRSWSLKLSDREVEVVEALRQGQSNKDIAQQLEISERTVKAHLTSVFQKIGVEDRLQLLIKLTARQD